MNKIRKGDEVIVLAGRDKGSQHDDFVALADLVHGASFRELQGPGTRSS